MNLFDSKAKAKIKNENDAIKNPFDLKAKAKINNKNDLKKLKLKLTTKRIQKLKLSKIFIV